MSDRFKFRCWDNINEEWMDCIHLDIDTGYITGFYNPEQAQKRRYTLMQCTGLKDKNGKLIYEGDILRYPPKEQYEEKNYVACEVFFHNNDCCENHIGFQMNRFRFQGALCGIANFGTKYRFIPKNTEKMEIIGNRYENKELLNDN